MQLQRLLMAFDAAISLELEKGNVVTLKNFIFIRNEFENVQELIKGKESVVLTNLLKSINYKIKAIHGLLGVQRKKQGPHVTLSLVNCDERP